MILCNEIQVCVEARHLKAHHHHCKQRSKGSKKSTLETKGKNTSLQLHPNNIGAPSALLKGSKVERAEDFRPTAPGRSPGVGHSIQN